MTIVNSNSASRPSAIALPKVNIVFAVEASRSCRYAAVAVSMKPNSRRLFRQLIGTVKQTAFGVPALIVVAQRVCGFRRNMTPFFAAAMYGDYTTIQTAVQMPPQITNQLNICRGGPGIALATASWSYMRRRSRSTPKSRTVHPGC